MGMLSCLSVTEGDLKISFDTQDKPEAVRAKRMIEDMLKRGYALFIETKSGLRRVRKFNAKRGEYIIADYDPTVEDNGKNEKKGKAKEEKIPPIKLKRRKKGKKTVKMESTNATAVAPSAGG